jgi:hypothetical protein
VPLPDGDQPLARRKEPVDRPISISKKARKRLLEPGYWGYLEEEELEFIQAELQENLSSLMPGGFTQYREPALLRGSAEWRCGEILKTGWLTPSSFGGAAQSRAFEAQLILFAMAPLVFLPTPTRALFVSTDFAALFLMYRAPLLAVGAGAG